MSSPDLGTSVHSGGSSLQQNCMAKYRDHKPACYLCTNGWLHKFQIWDIITDWHEIYWDHSYVLPGDIKVPANQILMVLCGSSQEGHGCPAFECLQKLNSGKAWEWVAYNQWTGLDWLTGLVDWIKNQRVVSRYIPTFLHRL